MPKSPYATYAEEVAHQQPLDPEQPPWRHLPIAHIDSERKVVVDRGPFPGLQEFLDSREYVDVLEVEDVPYVILRNRMGRWGAVEVGSGVAPGVDYRPSELVPWPDPAGIPPIDGTFSEHRRALRQALDRLQVLEDDGWAPVRNFPEWMVDEASR